MTASPSAKTAPTSPITAVIFDMGAVLIDWDPRYLYRQIFSDETEMEVFLSEVCPPAWNVEMDRGRPVDEALAERQALFPDHHEAIQAWKDRWPEMIVGTVPGSVDLLRRLYEAGVPLYGLTNFSAETWPKAEALFGFLTWFSDILVSGQEKLLKPDAEIFERLLSRNGLTASHCLFIDDSEKNIIGAQAVGLQVHHFKNAEGLKACLDQEGLLEPGFTSEALV